MTPSRYSQLWAWALTLLIASGAAGVEPGTELFSDDFESDLSGWLLSNPQAVTIIDSGAPDHGHVLRMAAADARMTALIRGSEHWRGYRIEGEVLFPDNVHNYLGLIYNYTESERRIDLGSIYIKGNGSYIRVNPRRDFNPARMLYEEYRTPLTGDDAIVIGQWQRFAAEVVGPVCHFYVGDMTTPKVTFDYYEHASGKAGFKPRVVGGPVWIDNVRAVAIDGLSYGGPIRPPGIEHEPGKLLTDWQVLGPLSSAVPAVEKATGPGTDGVFQDGAWHRWRRFATDPRGAVVTGRLTEFYGDRNLAYLRTTIEVAEGEQAELQISTIDDLAGWTNGVFHGYWTRDRFAWYDFRKVEPGDGLPLEPGTHHLLLRVRGGQYATGGFFARVVREARTSSETP
ncbi:MAG: hypothetical protein GY719_01290 [bacterium]|nr:hypothetical protein [bacterium]